jgi:hypothetical protein
MKWHHVWGTNVHGTPGSVPGDWLQLKGMTYPPVVSVTEDAFTLWLGTSDEWMCHMSRTDARRLAWFILFRWWLCAEWCGLRRWLFYKSLSAYLKRTTPVPSP